MGIYAGKADLPGVRQTEFDLGSILRGIDPDGSWKRRSTRRTVREPLRVSRVGGLHRLVSLGQDGLASAFVHRSGGEKGEPRVAMLLVVPREESSAPKQSIRVAAKTIGVSRGAARQSGWKSRDNQDEKAVSQGP